MSEQNDGSTLAIEGAAESPQGRDQPSVGFKLPSAIHAVAWSTGAAAIGWLATCLGQTYRAGKNDALGLDALSLPPIDQRQTWYGIGMVLQSAIAVVALLIAARLVYLLLRWAKRRVGPRFHLNFPTFVRTRLWWIVFVLVLADAAFFFGTMKEFQKRGRGLLLKSTSEVGATWTQVVFDEDHETASSLDIAYGGGLALFVGLSWWLISTKFEQPWAKIAFSLYAVSGTLSFLFGYSYLRGMADTVRDFPVIAYSGMTESDRGYICFLLGEDDKMFALLNIKLDDKMEVATRYIAYLPRTEVKWMTVIRYMPIYRVADLNDFKRLAEQVKNSSR
jgi:hypothetical protein